MRRLLALTFALATLAAVSDAGAQAPKPETLLQRMKTWLEPARSSTRKLIMTVRSTPGDVVQWTAAQARGTTDEGNFVLTVLLEPADVRGTALLIQERTDQPNSEWLYLPYLRRVRRVLPVDEFGSFLNTEFTDSDMGFVNLQHRKVTLLGRETLIGTDTYQVQEMPEDQRTFKRIVSWLAKDDQRPVKREYYDVANRLWKVETFEDVATVHDTPTAQRVRMEDLQTGYGSEYRVKDLAYGVPVPKELFDWQQLPKASDHPIWK